MIGYRDPRNGPEIDQAVDRLERYAVAVIAAIDTVMALLGDDVELTPEQANRIATAVAPIGAGVYAILVEDLDRTARRESSPVH